MAEQPETTVALYGLDLREAHGVVLVLYAPTDEVDVSATKVLRAPKPPPRFSTIEKDDISEEMAVQEELRARASNCSTGSPRRSGRCCSWIWTA